MKPKKLIAWRWTPEGIKKTDFKLTDKPGYDELPIGGIMPGPSTSRFSKTGDWRSFKPVIDEDKCNKCGLCWVYCPDSSILPVDDKYQVDLDYCKGCGICAEECPQKAITMIEEVEV